MRRFVIREPRRKVYTLPLTKAGPYIGPRGGKWADPQHTIPWQETVHGRAQARAAQKEAKASPEIQAALEKVRKVAVKNPKVTDPTYQLGIAQTILAQHKGLLETHKSNLTALVGERAIQVKARTKTPHSALEKVARKPKTSPTKGYADVSELQDVTGAMAIVHTVADIRSTIADLKAKYTVLGEDNYVDNPSGSLKYRAHHLVVKDPTTGFTMEVQVKTPRQQKHQAWMHDIYKPLNETQERWVLEHGEELSRYAAEMSDHYFALDSGIDPPPTTPPCPQVAAHTFGCLS